MKKNWIYATMAVVFTLVSCDNEDIFEGGDNSNTGNNVQNSTALYINELAASDDFVEIYNASDEAINIGGYQVNDDAYNYDEYYNFPAGTIIAAKGFYHFEKEKLEEQGLSVFGISGDGDAVTLFDTEGKVVSHVEIPEEEGASYGRITDGGNEFKWFATATAGSSNTGNGGSNEEGNSDVSSIKGLYINEVHPNGTPEDWVELFNSTNNEIDLSNFILHDAKGAEDADAYTIPAGTKIAAGGVLLLDKFAFGISKSGDDVVLLDSEKKVVDKVAVAEYSDADETAGNSYSRQGDGASTWAYSSPTMGTSNGKIVTSVIINEVYTYGDESSIEMLDWIELYNTTDSEINLEGMKLWEGGGAEEAWTIPAGKKIAAKGRLVITCDKDGLLSDAVNHPAWGLSKGPDEVVVLADADNNIIDEVYIPSLIKDESYGRLTDGAASWVIFKNATEGSANSGAQRPSHNISSTIFINEVLHDSDDSASEEWRKRDYIELYNATSSPVDLSGYKMYDDKGEDLFTIPAGTIIAAGGFVTFEALEDKKLGDVADGTRFEFGLGKSGDWVYLYNAAGRTADDIYANLVDIVELPSFSDTYEDLGYTYGRTTDGAADFSIFTVNSKNASNNGKSVVAK